MKYSHAAGKVPQETERDDIQLDEVWSSPAQGAGGRISAVSLEEWVAVAD